MTEKVCWPNLKRLFFLRNHSVGGGTGSGMGMLILERLAIDYRKKCKIGFELVFFFVFLV